MTSQYRPLFRANRFNQTVLNFALVLCAGGLFFPLVSHAAPAVTSCHESFVDQKDWDKLRTQVIREYARFVRLYLREPSSTELAQTLAMSTKDTEDLFGAGRMFADTNVIREEILKRTPRAFDKVMDGRFLQPEYLAKIDAALVRAPGFIVTSVNQYTPVNAEAWASLKAFAKAKGYQIMVRPTLNLTTGVAPEVLNDPDVLIALTDLELSPHLKISAIGLTPKMVNPFAGLAKLGKRGQSLIVAHPQRKLESVATSNNDTNPHMLLTTMSMNDPIYNGVHAIQLRTAYIAQDSHRIGAVVIEKSYGTSSQYFSDVGGTDAPGFFHSRFVEFKPQVGIIDGRYAYAANGDKKRLDTKALVFPDIHFGETDRQFYNHVGWTIKYYQPEYGIFHDFFNGHSVNHHESERLFTRIQSLKEGKLDLKKEIDQAAVHLSSILAQSSGFRIKIIWSNHDDWVDQWLNSKKNNFLLDPLNAEIGVELAGYKVAGRSALIEALRKRMTPQDFNRIDWITSGNFEELGIQLGQHGHQGVGGSRGTPRTMRLIANASVSGHVHTTSIDRDTFSVGTGSVLRPKYIGTSPSSWSHSILAITDHKSPDPEVIGGTQLLVMRDGEFWADQKQLQAAKAAGRKFFHPGFPKVAKPVDPSLGVTVDQWSHRLPPAKRD